MTKGRQATILVVEDNGALRRLMLRILSVSGFAVLDAASASQGLDVFRLNTASIDLAIVDMIMPGMSGLDLAAEIERQRPGMKILYISGYASSVAIESISRRSPERVLLKPFDARQLIASVRTLLELDAGLSDGDVDTATALNPSSPAWDRLIEASDSIAPGAVQVLGYKDTGAAFGVAAAHSAALRAAGLGYSFRPNTQDAHPFALFVAPTDADQAREVIGRVGLGVDVEQPV